MSEDHFLRLGVAVVKGFQVPRVSGIRFPFGFDCARRFASSQQHEVDLSFLFISPVSQLIFPAVGAELVENKVLPKGSSILFTDF